MFYKFSFVDSVKGFIVCFDGIDGSGKCTQSGLLQQRLAGEGIAARVHSYPDYSSLYGSILGSFLAGKVQLSVDELFLLYLADMVRDRSTVEKELSEGMVVIMDRYYFATIAYQTAGGFAYEKAKAIEERIGLPIPEITFYLDVDSETSVSRKTKEKMGIVDRFEADARFLERVRVVYDRLFSEGYRSGKWVKIDGSQPPDAIADEVLGAVRELAVDRL